MPEKGFWLNGLSVIIQYGLVILMYYFLYQILNLMRADLGFDFRILRSKHLPAKLNVLQSEGALPERQIFFIQNKLSIGRDRENDIVIDDAYVSHVHAVIRLNGNDYWIEDLKSINHTYLNGTTLERRTVLTSGDMIRIGLVTFKFER